MQIKKVQECNVIDWDYTLSVRTDQLSDNSREEAVLEFGGMSFQAFVFAQREKTE